MAGTGVPNVDIDGRLRIDHSNTTGQYTYWPADSHRAA
jgi:hypothetical protein